MCRARKRNGHSRSRRLRNEIRLASVARASVPPITINMIID
jgi:hypothetical protein